MISAKNEQMCVSVFERNEKRTRDRWLCDYLFFVASDTEETYRDPERFTHSESNVSRSMLGTPSFIEEEENEQDYEAQADDVVEKVWRIFLDNTSWSQEAKSVDGQDVVFSKTFPKWGKVFRLTVRRRKNARKTIAVFSFKSVIPTSRDELVEFLYDRQEDMSKWNPTVNDCRVMIPFDIMNFHQKTSFFRY